jgi:hypothetical protein
MLSIVDLNPSDEDCIYSTLVFVMNQARKFNIKTPNITFDQPLYIKAVDISLKAHLDIVVRLGGFHTLMSFLGSMGHLMKGSGLEEVLGLIFGPNTVEHILSGKAYARSVRGHFLVHAALTDILLDYLKNLVNEDENVTPVVVSTENAEQLGGAFSEDMMLELNLLYEKTFKDKVNAQDNNLLECESLVRLSQLLQDLKRVLSKESRTARLWILYMRYIDVM